MFRFACASPYDQIKFQHRCLGFWISLWDAQYPSQHKGPQTRHNSVVVERMTSIGTMRHPSPASWPPASLQHCWTSRGPQAMDTIWSPLPSIQRAIFLAQQRRPLRKRWYFRSGRINKGINSSLVKSLIHNPNRCDDRLTGTVWSLNLKRTTKPPFL